MEEGWLAHLRALAVKAFLVAQRAMPLRFGAYMLVGVVWCVWLHSTSPEVLERIREDLRSNRAVSGLGEDVETP